MRITVFCELTSSADVGSDYPYPLGTEADLGFRAKRIVELIEQDRDKISIDDVKAIQADVLDRRALEVLPYLRSLNLEPSAAELKELDDDRKDVSEKERRKKAEADAKDLAAASEARDRLLSWDGRMTVDSAEAVLFACFYQRLIDEVFRDQYPETRWAPADHSRPKNDLWYLLRDEENVATRSSPARSARAMDSPRKSSART